MAPRSKGPPPAAPPQPSPQIPTEHAQEMRDADFAKIYCGVVYNLIGTCFVICDCMSAATGASRAIGNCRTCMHAWVSGQDSICTCNGHGVHMCMPMHDMQQRRTAQGLHTARFLNDVVQAKSAVQWKSCQTRLSLRKMRGAWYVHAAMVSCPASMPAQFQGTVQMAVRCRGTAGKFCNSDTRCSS